MIAQDRANLVRRDALVRERQQEYGRSSPVLVQRSNPVADVPVQDARPVSVGDIHQKLSESVLRTGNEVVAKTTPIIDVASKLPVSSIIPSLET